MKSTRFVSWPYLSIQSAPVQNCQLQKTQTNKHRGGHCKLSKIVGKLKKYNISKTYNEKNRTPITLNRVKLDSVQYWMDLNGVIVQFEWR